MQQKQHSLDAHDETANPRNQKNNRNKLTRQALQSCNFRTTKKELEQTQKLFLDDSLMEPMDEFKERRE